MRAPALVADPAGNADVQVEVEVAEQRLLLPGEAVHHRGRQLVAEVAQDLQQTLAGVAFVQKNR
ncbi:hypothetical protein D9M71_827610 [compost metagenome]